MIETASLHDNAYLHDILAQPTALRATLAALAATDLAPFYTLANRLASGDLRRVVLTGMGSSYHALHPIYLRLLNHGLAVQRIETSELLHYLPNLLDPTTLLVTVSQSGQSIEIKQLLERVGNRLPLVAVTNSTENPLAQQATATLITQAGPEATVSCKTYTSALLALAVLSRTLTGESPQALLAELQAIPEAVANYLEHWEAHVQAASQQLAETRYLILAGRGTSLAATGTGGLIIKESARFPTEGMSSAAFRHGPLEMVGPHVFVLVYEGDAPTAKLNAGLVQDVRAAGGQSALVQQSTGHGLFNLPQVPLSALPILEILPAQMVSLALALLQGHAPGVFARATKITLDE